MSVSRAKYDGPPRRNVCSEWSRKYCWCCCCSCCSLNSRSLCLVEPTRVLYAHLMSVLIIIIIVIIMHPLQFSLVKQQIIIWTCRFMQIARGVCIRKLLLCTGCYAHTSHCSVLDSLSSASGFQGCRNCRNKSRTPRLLLLLLSRCVHIFNHTETPYTHKTTPAPGTTTIAIAIE